MSNRKIISKDMARSVAEACLCLHVQRAARALARHFDDVFRPLDLTSGQYSLLMSLNRPAPTMGDTADFLAMDRTTLTAALKPLERRGLVRIAADENDRRIKRLALTPAGNAVLAKPAEETPLIAAAAIDILYEAGVPRTALQLLPGDGRIGAALVAAPQTCGVMFTNSSRFWVSNQSSSRCDFTRYSAFQSLAGRIL